MPRTVLPLAKVHSGISEDVGGKPDYRQVVADIEKAIEENRVVVVGMDQNPYPKKARKLLERLGIAYRYMEYGSYFSQWHLRGAIKMWSGWQTFPMIFINGQLVGGYSDLLALNESGELKQLLG